MIIRDRDGLDSACTILVVDDAQDVLEVMTEIVVHLGYRAVPLSSGMAAIDYLAAGSRADAAIVDLCLPVMDGIQIIRALRGLKPGLAALLVSGRLGADERAFAGDVVLLQKPFRISEMDAALGRALEISGILNAPSEKAGRAAAG